MTSRLNWRNASLAAKPSTSVVDESERQQDDRAARWLAKAEKGRRSLHSKSKRKNRAAPERQSA